MLSLLLTAIAAPTLPLPQGPIAIRAGEIHAVEGGRIHRDAVLLIEGGRIVALGSDVAVPAHAEVVDYGPGSVLVPGFVAASSRLAEGAPSERTAEPGLKAIDGFDFYSSYVDALAGGVTSAYITPARGRLIAGQAAVVKLAGDNEAERVLKAPAAIHGAVSAEARRTPGYWQPPVPATSDVGLGVPLEQLPRTIMGAVLALGELLDGAAAGRAVAAYGPNATQDLAPLMAAKVPWRITAVTEEELRAVLHIAVARKLPVILDGAHFAGDLAAEIVAAKAGVVYELPFQPGRPGQDRGVDPDEPKPSLDVPARLRAAGVSVAFSMPGSAPLRDLRLAAILGSRGGLSEADALRGLTLTPAEFYGVADRVGSLAAGKHADFAVFSGSPLDATSTVRATWVGGKLAYEPRVSYAGGTLVVRAEELHLGDGHVLRPGEVLVRDGRIAEVGERVGRPAGAVVLHAPAAMPGMIDMLSRVGLGGSRRTPSTDYRLGQIVAPGDSVGLAVARAGVTTVVMDPPGGSATGVPMLAYRPAAMDFDGMVVSDPVALRFGWSDANRLRAGAAVKDVLAKAVDYQKRWREYEEKLAAWKPKPAEPEVVLPAKPEDEAKPAEGDEKKEEAKEEEKKPAPKRRGKDEPKPVDPDPVTGIWTAEVVRPPLEGTTALRMQVRLSEGKVEGYLRSAALSERLIEVNGHWTDAKLVLTGIGDEGRFALTGTIEEAKLTGQITLGETAIELSAERTTRDYPVAKRSGPSTATPAPPAATEDPKGKPKEPRVDGRLEPMRRALEGKAAVYVEVTRADEIVACVDAFAAVGIKPILVGADDAHLVLDSLVGRVAGVLLSHDVVESRPEDGVARRNRYADLLAAGIPIGFHSAAADGARDLPLMAAYAVAQGLSPVGSLRALTSAAADMLVISDRVGRLAPGLLGDLVLLDGSPLDPRSQVTRVVVGGREVK